jgi:hypothetical protein
MNVELIPYYVRLPGWTDTTVLEVIGYGVWIALEQHKFLNLPITDTSIMEHAKLTMGDHALELLPGCDIEFESNMQMALQGLDLVMATQSGELETFATLLNGIDDIMVIPNPGVIGLFIKENPLVGNYQFLFQE